MKNNFYIGCENAASATAKMSVEFFNQYEFTEGLKGESWNFFFGNEEDMIDRLIEMKEKLSYRGWHYDLYIRPTNKNLEPIFSGWDKVEGGYSKKAIEYISVSR